MTPTFLQDTLRSQCFFFSILLYWGGEGSVLAVLEVSPPPTVNCSVLKNNSKIYPRSHLARKGAGLAHEGQNTVTRTSLMLLQQCGAAVPVRSRGQDRSNSHYSPVGLFRCKFLHHKCSKRPADQLACYTTQLI